MFNSIYSDKLSQYYELRCGVLSESAQKHELCYLKRFDNYLNAHIRSTGQITERFINAWVGTLNGKSGSVENEVITIRQFLKYLTLSGEPAFSLLFQKCVMIMFRIYSAIMNSNSSLNLQIMSSYQIKRQIPIW